MLNGAKFSPTERSNKNIFMIISLLIFIYLINNFVIKTYISSFILNYIINSILWLLVVIIIWQIPHNKPSGKLRLRSFIYQWAFIFAILYIVISVFTGLIVGFGKSPYNHSIIGILTNIIFVGSSLVGREFIRSYLVNSSTKKDDYLVFIPIALLMTFTKISFNKFLEVFDFAALVEFLAGYVGPRFAENLFAVYLVYLGGPLASIIYLGVIEGFNWLSPILPNLQWITTALIGILCPIFFLMVMQSTYNSATRKIKMRDQEGESPTSWIITSIISIGIIWFAVGVFPIYPSVIATGSMKPMIKPGDIILVKKIVDMDGINSLKEGDVIQFQRDSMLISHRIIEVVNDEKEGIQFITKGDNNSGEDTDFVRPEDIKGTIEQVVPKIGWVTLLIKSDKDVDLDKIEF